METAESNLNHEFYVTGTVSTSENSLDEMSMISAVETQNESGQVDGIEILVQMAKNGKIDPWNVDIVDVTDKYLAHLFQMKAQNLRLTGRTLLFAAILLRLKSNVLEGIDANQIEGLEEENYEDYELEDDSWNEDDINTNNVISLDEVLQRRTSVRLNRSRMVNLKDLIKQLQFYEELDRKQSLKNAHERAKRRVRSYARLTPDDIVNLAHDEYIEKSVEVLHENLKKIFETEEKVELNTLTLLGLDKISAYIALLFLTAEPEADIDLYQEEFYGELYAVPYKKTIESEKESA
ncbi:MAG: segregation/condensation protein A [Clostridium sp.]|nr:segregation/condensation protein A [Clostridium sp.]